MAPKPYQSYKVIEPFVANSYQELIETIEKTLSEMIKEINEPLQDCSNCHGTGVILKEIKK